MKVVKQHGKNFEKISKGMGNRTVEACKWYCMKFKRE